MLTKPGNAIWNATVRRQVSPIGLSLFRIAYSTVLLCEVTQLFYFRHLVFDPIPYVSVAETSYTPALIAWIVAIACLIVGIFTRTACVVNYVMTLLTFSTFHAFEYHTNSLPPPLEPLRRDEQDVQ